MCGLGQAAQGEQSVVKIQVMSRYKFGLAFENTRDPDYMTEKVAQLCSHHALFCTRELQLQRTIPGANPERAHILNQVFEVLEAGAVPVYLGAPNWREFLPWQSPPIIDAGAFEWPHSI